MGGSFPVENGGKGEGPEGGGWGGWGGGVGTGKGTGKSMRKLCRNYPLAIYPLVSPQEIHSSCGKCTANRFSKFWGVGGGTPNLAVTQRARRGILMPRGKNCRETILPLNCRAITLATGAVLKEEKMSSIVGERQFGRHFKRQFERG